MSILVLMDRFLPDDGGTIRWMVNVYSRWPKADVVFVVPEHPNSKNIDGALPFSVLRLPMGFQSWDPTTPNALMIYIRLVFSIRKICLAHRIQQIHCVQVLPDSLLAWWICYLTGLPYFVYAHGEEIKTGMTSRKYKWLMPRIYNNAEAVIANSGNTKNLLKEIGVNLDQIIVINPGVDALRFSQPQDNVDEIKIRYDLGESPVLLTIGRLQRRKGQDMVIKALPKIKAVYPQVKYVIAGDGEERSYLEQLVEEVGVRDSVAFTGRIEEKELPSFYAVCDVFVMPNRQIRGDIEGFGMVFLEANAAGKPVIGGKSGGTNESIQEGITGFRVDGENINEISDAILKILSHPDEARQMGKRGQKWVNSECSWDAVLERTRQVTSGMHSVNS